MKSNISFIHCADIHMDAPFSAMGKEDFSTERRKDLKKTFEKIVDMAIEHDVDFLIISGDLYEHEYASRSNIRWLNEQYKRLGQKPVILVPGNHDPYVKNSWYRSYPWNDNVHILTTEKPEYIEENLGVYFYGIGFGTFYQETLPMQKQPVILQDRVNICLFHGTVDMQFAKSAHNPVELSFLTDLGFDYYALGHFHSKKEVDIEKGIVYPGSPEPLGFDEMGEHGVFLVQLTKEDTVRMECSFIKTQQRAYHEVDVNIDGIDSYDQLEKRLDDVMETYEQERDIFKINLKGRISPDFHIDLEQINDKLDKSCFCVKFNDLTQPMYNLEELSEERTLTGVFVRKMQEKIESAHKNGQAEEKEIFERALYLGLEALIEGKVDL